MKENNESEIIIAVATTTVTINRKRLLKLRERNTCILINITFLSLFTKKHLS